MPSHKGVFKAKAEEAGETTPEYAEQESNAPGTLGKQARLAKTLMGLKKKKKVASIHG